MTDGRQQDGNAIYSIIYSIIIQYHLAAESAQEASHEVGIYEYEKAGDLCLFCNLNVVEKNS